MRQSGHATSPWSEAHPTSSADPFTHLSWLLRISIPKPGRKRSCR